MPRLYEYKYKDGFYIKTRIKGRMVTYQLTNAGVNLLKENGYDDGDQLSIKTLHILREADLVYTNNSGPSELLENDTLYDFSDESENDLSLNEDEVVVTENDSETNESLNTTPNSEYDTQSNVPSSFVDENSTIESPPPEEIILLKRKPKKKNSEPQKCNEIVESTEISLSQESSFVDEPNLISIKSINLKNDNQGNQIQQGKQDINETRMESTLIVVMLMLAIYIVLLVIFYRDLN